MPDSSIHIFDTSGSTADSALGLTIIQTGGKSSVIQHFNGSTRWVSGLNNAGSYIIANGANLSTNARLTINSSGLVTIPSCTLSAVSSGQLVISNGSSAVTGVGYGTSNSASIVVQRDSNQNIFVNTAVQKSISLVSTGITINLPTNFGYFYTLLGTGVDVILPDATTLTQTGFAYRDRDWETSEIDF